ncbi:MAG: hypothetical protein ACP5M4_09885 [Acidobacteriaceae bacterium]
MSRQLERLLRVRRLMEEMSRAEFTARRLEQAEMERRRDAARESSLALRGDARAVLAGEGADATQGVWQRLLADSDESEHQGQQWAQAARQSGERVEAAERKYLEERRGRMQAEIVVRERAAVERVERERREQREIDDWFGMKRGARRAHGRQADAV